MEKYVFARLLQNPAVADALEVRQDIISIKAAQGVDFARLQRDVRKIEDAIEIANRLALSDGHEGSKAHEKLQSFLTEANLQLHTATKICAESKEAFAELCVYFGEDAKSTPQYLFSILDDFLKRVGLAIEKQRRMKK